ncbi:MAG TPA: hypothetical protein PK886_00475 [Candidatus Paceibacterota bacterium]|nr:hypothetical protein [Candidatus Paceibacterota bacterium]
MLKSDALSHEAKQKITALYQMEISPDIIAQIQDIIQDEIDRTFNEAGILIDQNELELKMNEMENDFKLIEKNTKEDLEIVRNELDNLESIVNQIEESIDQDKIEDLRKEITV